MKPLATQTAEEKNWEYAQTLPEFKGEAHPKTIKDAQLKKPLFEFSGACAGCGETPYVKLVTQLFGDRMIVANATGCSSIYGGSAPTCPYTTNNEGHGPAWANSLFEDNAEFGFGMNLAVTQRRKKLADTVAKLIAIPYCDEEIQAAGKEWLEGMDDAEASKAAGAKLLAACKKATDPARDLTGTPGEAAWLANGKVCPCEACTLAREVVADADMLTKKSIWIFGGDGWAYDIGYGGLDHVLAQGEDVNVLVLDTEVYSNTGGQASKSTPTGSVAKFAAAGKRTRKKDLGLMAMSYGYVYVAQVAMGADMNQLIKAMTEAEAYKGPSLIIAYAPCINHGIKMNQAQAEIKKAVAAGYWTMYRYNRIWRTRSPWIPRTRPRAIRTSSRARTATPRCSGSSRTSRPRSSRNPRPRPRSASRPTSAWPASKPSASVPRAPQGRAGQSAAKARRRERSRRRVLSL